MRALAVSIHQKTCMELVRIQLYEEFCGELLNNMRHTLIGHQGQEREWQLEKNLGLRKFGFLNMCIY